MNKLQLAILSMAFAALLGASAQVLFKKANPQLDASIITNGWLIAGITLYIIAFVINLLAYRAGDASMLYPIISLSYVFIMFLAAIFLKEPLTAKKLIGSGLIVGGVVLIAFG